jgi:hypothetical protein
MKPSAVGLVAVIAGCAVAVVGLGAYQAWWTVVFAIGGFAVLLLTQQQMAPARSIAIGSAIAGSILLAGMSLFLLYGSLRGPARPCEACDDTGTMWLVASIASIVTAILLLLVARRLVRARPTT